MPVPAASWPPPSWLRPNTVPPKARAESRIERMSMGRAGFAEVRHPFRADGGAR